MGEHLPVHLRQRRRRFHAEPVDQHRPRPPERRERVGLPVGPVERGQQPPPQPLVARVPGDQRLQLGHQLRAGAGRQVRVEAVQQHAEPPPLPPGTLDGQRPGVRELLVRRAAPQPERFGEPAGRLGGAAAGQRLPPGRGGAVEPGRVQHVRTHPQQVSRRPGDQLGGRPGRLQHPAQPRHVRPHGPLRTGRRLLAPQRVDQRRDADRAAGLRHEHRQPGTQPRPAEVEHPLPGPHLERAEHPDLDRAVPGDRAHGRTSRNVAAGIHGPDASAARPRKGSGDLEQEVVLVDEDLLPGALEDRDRPAARRDRRLEVLVDDRQVGELQAAAAQVEQVRSVLEAGDRVAERRCPPRSSDRSRCRRTDPARCPGRIRARRARLRAGRRPRC